MAPAEVRARESDLDPALVGMALNVAYTLALILKFWVSELSPSSILTLDLVSW